MLVKPQPKISVIVPLYKTERYVEKCLTSILEQTLEDIEVICVDDCSPDNSISIAEGYAKIDSRISILRHTQNLGLGGARNTGILAAKAAYIASVDSDDYIDRDMMAALWEGTDQGHFDVVICGYVRVDGEGTVLSKHQTSKYVKIDPIPKDQNPFLISNPAFWNKLWRRSLYVDNNIFFPHHIYHQDSATTPRIYTKARNVRFIGGEYYKYLVRGDSATNSTSDKHLLDRFREIDTLKDYFVGVGDYERLSGYFQERILKGYAYHAENVLANRKNEDEATEQYLRHLLIMREGYLALDDTVRRMSLKEKVAAFEKHVRIPLMPDPGVFPGMQETATGVAQKAVHNARPPLPEKPKVLVLTMFSGENEFGESCRSLALQNYSHWEHLVFKGLENMEAHRRLYNAIMERKESFDLFIKLDADMTFSRRDVLEDIIGEFRRQTDLDHLIIACADFMTGENIMGVHTFSNRVSWQENSRGIFNDPSPRRPGRRAVIKNPKSQFFGHSTNPSPYQAFHFGAHRALKLVQRDLTLKDKRPEPMITQWGVMKGLWRQFSILGDRRHGLALVAADLVINEHLDENVHNYGDEGLFEAYRKAAVRPTDLLRKSLEAVWESEASQRAYFERAVGHDGLARIAEFQEEQEKAGP